MRRLRPAERRRVDADVSARLISSMSAIFVARLGRENARVADHRSRETAAKYINYSPYLARRFHSWNCA